ncbi:hypothetical protein SRABI80_04897 [Peribacillus frigoritolerans]|nr:hypothetical protein SRABI80_04897 [Peribacillus frigoritolerans]
MAENSSERAYSEYPPDSIKLTTLVPGLILVTFPPTSTTTPATSAPGMNGSGVGTTYCPSLLAVSA